MEAPSGSVQLGGPVARSFVVASALPRDAAYLVTAIALWTRGGFGFSWSRRADFRTAP